MQSTQTQKEKMSVIAKRYAVTCHRATAHIYDNRHPYDYHLQMVVDMATRFLHLLPEDEEIRENVIGGCWTHDLLEDCRESYNDVKKATNEMVAELSYACTNEKGKNRKERANDKYYEGIRNTPYAIFVKMCDRLANAEYSARTQSRMIEMYRKENPEFVKKIYDPKYQEMYDFLDKILASN